MDMLEVLHVLTDHEQVVLPVVDDLKFFNDRIEARMGNPEAKRCFLTGNDNRWNRSKLQLVIAHIVGGRFYQRHSASRTLSGDIKCEIRMHRTQECCLFVLGSCWRFRNVLQKCGGK